MPTATLTDLSAVLTATKKLQADTVLGSDYFFENVVPNVWILIAHVLSAVVVIAVVIFLLWHPTKLFIQKRRELYNQNLTNAINDKKSAEKLLSDTKAEKIKTEKIMSDLLYKSQVEADEIKINAETSAKQKARAIYDKAVSDADQIKKDTQSRINANVADLAIDIAGKIIGKNADSDLNKKFVDEYLDAQ